jgi:predicted Zn-dependent protease with MMP-like domain
MRGMPYVVTKEEFAALVELALEELPERFREFLEEVPIEIHDRPTPRQLKSVGLGRNDLLLGLYHGRPRTKRHVEDSGFLPDVIYIFQEHVQAACRTEGELVREVRKTVLHEIGHHFGLDEDDLDKLGYG